MPGSDSRNPSAISAMPKAFFKMIPAQRTAGCWSIHRAGSWRSRKYVDGSFTSSTPTIARLAANVATNVTTNNAPLQSQKLHFSPGRAIHGASLIGR